MLTKKWSKYAATLISIMITVMVTNYAYIRLGEDAGANAENSNSVNNIERLGEVARERLANSIALYVGSPRVYVNNSEAQIDHSNPEVIPIVKEGRTLVPVRFISESIGAKVEWDPILSKVTISYGNKAIGLTLQSNIMYVNGEKVELEVKAEAENGRTLVPIRAISEAFGKKIFYNRGLIIIGDREDIFNPDTEKVILDEIIAKINILPIVGSYEKLQELLENNLETVSYTRQGEAFTLGSNVKMAVSESVSDTSGSASQKSMNTDKAESTYSKTNTQVEGVDEADVVKTDGEYIYKVNKRQVVIAKANPVEEMKLVNTLDFEDQNFYPREMYIDENNLVVIGNTQSIAPYVYDNGQVQSSQKMIRPDIIPNVFQVVRAIVYDITDKSNIKSIREIEVEGDYISSRKIGKAVYMVTNKHLNYYIMKNGESGAKGDITPKYKDTAIGQEYVKITYDRIQYFPKFKESNYMIIAGFDIDNQTEKVNVSTYLGSGQNIYVSLENMYVAVTHYEAPRALNEEENFKIMPNPYYYEPNTLVYKFSLNEGKITYLAKGSVPGTILNQFSMDENIGNFRIATTRNNPERDNETMMDNNLYVLDDIMSIVGRLERIAPNERIYSVRFIGERGYMVTFKNVDPLFVIDLKDPKQPKILGALKIPGYSDYLHPYDENHIIGFGKDTVEIPYKDDKGNVVGSNAYYLGIKMAIFDVSDVSNPVEKYVEKIGDRGTDSELLRNHKALLFSKEKNLLAFPITVMKVKGNNAVQNNFPEYGQFEFQGAYVYNIDLQSGFKLKNRITHLTNEEYIKAGNYGADADKNVERIIYIEDNLYTLSSKMIQAHDINELKHKKTIEIIK